MNIRRTLCVTLTLAFTALTHAQELMPLDRRAEAEGARVARNRHAVLHPKEMTTCAATPISPPVTINGALSGASCVDSVLGVFEDVYSVTVSAGQTIDVDYYSHSYDVFLYMYLGNGVSAPTTRISDLDVYNRGTSEVKMHYTFASSGTYKLEAESLFPPGYAPLPYAGAYTLVVSLSGGTPPPSTSSAQIVPIVGHLNGAGGSAFRSDLKLFNTSGLTTTGRIQFTQRGQSASASDAVISFSIPPKGVAFYPDVYLNAYPGGSGAARLSIVRDNAAPPLTIDTSTYTANADGGELAQTPSVLTSSDMATAGSVVVGILGKTSERTNLFIMTGSSDTTIQWRYRDVTGSGNATFTRTYPHDSTTQIAASDLLGFTPAPNASLEATITGGSAHVALSPVNNVSNQGRWVDFR